MRTFMLAMAVAGCLFYPGTVAVAQTPQGGPRARSRG
jgi:hypothetical protein